MEQTGPLPGEEPWVPPPVDGDLHWPSGKIFGGEATWTTYRGAHALCTICVQVVHEKGAQVAPRPMPATRKRKGPNGIGLYCARHGEVMKRKDDEIARRLKEQRAAAEHRARGRRSVAPH